MVSGGVAQTTPVLKTRYFQVLSSKDSARDQVHKVTYLGRLPGVGAGVAGLLLFSESLHSQPHP